MNFRWRPQLKDPKDEFVLEAAVNGHADASDHHVGDDDQDLGRALVSLDSREEVVVDGGMTRM